MYSPSNPRRVHDIFDLAGPIAFNQISQEKYQPICPWCGENIGDVVEAVVTGQLYFLCLTIIEDHVKGSACGGATKMSVVLKDGTLGELSKFYGV